MKHIILLYLFCFFTFGLMSQTTCDSVLYGGKWYHGVQIGNQCWFRENLDIGSYVASTNDLVPHSNVSDNGIIEKYCYDNNIANCNIYGGIYDWSEMMQYSLTEETQGICPVGWHVPSVDEWIILQSNFPSASAGTELKAGGSSGFDALPGGFRYATGAFNNEGTSYVFWTSTIDANNQNKAWFRYMSENNDSVAGIDDYIPYGFSVRCIKNITTSNNVTGNNNNMSINVYPNPCNGIINIELNNTQKPANNITLTITDKLGQNLLSEEYRCNSIVFTKQIDISEWSKGIYFVVFRVDNEVIRTHKILVF